MRYFAPVTDYDGTLTSTDFLAPATLAALNRVRASGRRVILVTGRRLEDLLSVCGCVGGFDSIVAENGAILYNPDSREILPLADPVSPQLVAALQRRGVQPLEVGTSIVATRVPHEVTVLNLIRELGLELQVIFNRTAVMILPPGVNKATGVRRALPALGLSPHEIVAVGDAENDHSFLQMSECPVAVHNAIDAIKETAAIVTTGAAGEGVEELADLLIETDLNEIDQRLTRHHLKMGTGLDGTTVSVPPYGRSILVAGPSGSGKSSFASGFIEGLAEKFYQVCIIDPEGDYVGLPHAVTIGAEDSVPSTTEILELLRDPGVNANVNLLGVPLADRPAYLSQLLPHLQSMRALTGRPHWLVMDEARHLLPSAPGANPIAGLSETMLITVHPDHMAASALAMVDVVVAVGSHPDKTFHQFTRSTSLPDIEPVSWSTHESVAGCWFVRESTGPFPIHPIHGRAERIRHYRKYTLGDLHHASFYFRGPNNRLNLRAHNLAMFCQIAEGLDDATWEFHLRRGDYAQWINGVIKDEGLAQVVREVQGQKDLSPRQSRKLIHDAIDARYSLPE